MRYEVSFEQMGDECFSFPEALVLIAGAVRTRIRLLALNEHIEQAGAECSRLMEMEKDIHIAQQDYAELLRRQHRGLALAWNGRRGKLWEVLAKWLQDGGDVPHELKVLVYGQ